MRETADRLDRLLQIDVEHFWPIWINLIPDLVDFCVELELDKPVRPALAISEDCFPLRDQEAVHDLMKVGCAEKALGKDC